MTTYIEYQIDFLNAVITATATSYAAVTAADLERVAITTSKWVNPSFYFEVVMKESSTSYSAEAELYDVTSSGAVTGSTLTTTSTSYVRLRSGTLALTSGHTFSVYTASSSTSGTCSITAARIVVQDNITNGWTKGEEWETIACPGSTTLTTNQTLPVQWYYETTSVRGETMTNYLDASLYSSSASGTCSLILYDLTAGAAVTGGTLTSTATSATEYRTSAVALTNAHTYQVLLHGSSTSYTSYVTGAHMVLDQTAANQIARTQVRKNLGIPASGTLTTATNLYGLVQYDSGSFPATQSIYFEATMEESSASGTCNVILYDNTTPGAVTGGTITTSSTSYTRVRSSAVTVTNAHTLSAEYLSSSTSYTAYETCPQLILNVSQNATLNFVDTVTTASLAPTKKDQLSTPTYDTLSIAASLAKSDSLQTGLIDTVTAASSLLKNIQKSGLLASITATSSILKNSRPTALLASITAASSWSRSAMTFFRNFLGSITPASSWSKVWNSFYSKASSISLVSSISEAHNIFQTLSGSITLASSLLGRFMNKVLLGTATLGSSISHVWKSFLSLLGSLTLTSSLTKVHTIFQTLNATFILASSYVKTSTVFRTLAATMTPGSSILKLFLQHTQTASVSLVSSLVKSTRKSLSGSVTLVSSISKLAGKVLTGLASPSASITKLASKVNSASISLVSSLIKGAGKTLTGTITAASSVVKKPGKVLVGTLTLAGTFSRVWTTKPTFNATISAASSIAKMARKGLSGTVALVSSYLKVPEKGLAAFLTLTSSMSTLNKFFRSLQGTISLISSIVTTYIQGGAKTQKLYASLTIASSYVKQSTYQRVLNGMITLVSNYAKFYQTMKVASLVLTSSIVKQFNALKSGMFTLGSSLQKLPSVLKVAGVSLTSSFKEASSFVRSLSGSVLLTSSYLKNSLKSFSGKVVISSSMSRIVFKLFSGTFNILSSSTKSLLKPFSGTLGLASGLYKTLFKAFLGTLGISSSLMKLIFLIRSGSLFLASSKASSFFRLFKGTVQVLEPVGIGLIGKTFTKAVQGTLTLTSSFSTLNSFFRIFQARLSILGKTFMPGRVYHIAKILLQTNQARVKLESIYVRLKEKTQRNLEEE